MMGVALSCLNIFLFRLVSNVQSILHKYKIMITFYSVCSYNITNKQWNNKCIFVTLCDSRQVPSVKFISQFSTTEKKLMKNLSEQINRTDIPYISII